MLEDVGSFREVPAHVVDCGVYYLRHRIMEEGGGERRNRFWCKTAVGFRLSRCVSITTDVKNRTARVWPGYVLYLGKSGRASPNPPNESVPLSQLFHPSLSLSWAWEQRDVHQQPRVFSAVLFLSRPTHARARLRALDCSCKASRVTCSFPARAVAHMWRVHFLRVSRERAAPRYRCLLRLAHRPGATLPADVCLRSRGVSGWRSLAARISLVNRLRICLCVCVFTYSSCSSSWWWC